MIVPGNSWTAASITSTLGASLVHCGGSEGLVARLRGIVGNLKVLLWHVSALVTTILFIVVVAQEPRHNTIGLSSNWMYLGSVAEHQRDQESYVSNDNNISSSF
jgi:hypothetical protein